MANPRSSSLKIALALHSALGHSWALLLSKPTSEEAAALRKKWLSAATAPEAFRAARQAHKLACQVASEPQTVGPVLPNAPEIGEHESLHYFNFNLPKIEMLSWHVWIPKSERSVSLRIAKERTGKKFHYVLTWDWYPDREPSWELGFNLSEDCAVVIQQLKPVIGPEIVRAAWEEVEQASDSH